MVDEEDVLDAYSVDRNRETIETAKPNLRFGVTRDQTYGRVRLGLAKVREVQNGRVVFDDRFIAPTLDVRVLLHGEPRALDIVGPRAGVSGARQLALGFG